LFHDEYEANMIYSAGRNLNTERAILTPPKDWFCAMVNYGNKLVGSSFYLRSNLSLLSFFSLATVFSS